jgi:hypothetical protein
MGTGQLIMLIAEMLVFVIILPYIFKDFMDLWKEK